jgi:hypothetical protein
LNHNGSDERVSKKSNPYDLFQINQRSGSYSKGKTSRKLHEKPFNKLNPLDLD